MASIYDPDAGMTEEDSQRIQRAKARFDAQFEIRLSWVTGFATVLTIVRRSDGATVGGLHFSAGHDGELWTQLSLQKPGEAAKEVICEPAKTSTPYNAKYDMELRIREAVLAEFGEP